MINLVPKKSRWLTLLIVLLFLFVFAFTSTLTPSASMSSSVDDSTDKAYLHLNEVMDKFHNTFDVYTDQDAGGNHFFPSGWMGDLSAISFDSNWISDPHFGASSIKIVFTAKGNNWAGIYWQNPENNWGNVQNGGYDLTGATKLTF